MADAAKDFEEFQRLKKANEYLNPPKNPIGTQEIDIIEFLDDTTPVRKK